MKEGMFAYQAECFTVVNTTLIATTHLVNTTYYKIIENLKRTE